MRWKRRVPFGKDAFDPLREAGDAAHAFPPDLGQGVNAALEDVFPHTCRADPLMVTL